MPKGVQYSGQDDTHLDHYAVGVDESASGDVIAAVLARVETDGSLTIVDEWVRKETMDPLTIFVPGPLYNPMNGQHGHWSKRARWARNWRERTAQRLFVAQHTEAKPWFLRVDPCAPKAITFVLQTWNRVDDDALGPMVKPCRDALIDAGVIHSDAPRSGHVFAYAQCIDRQERGVRITVEVLNGGT